MPTEKPEADDTVNEFQKAVARTYGGGDFAYFAEEYPSFSAMKAALEHVGDPLFCFLMVELSTQEGCDSPEEARNRLENARDDIETGLSALDALDAAPIPAR